MKWESLVRTPFLPGVATAALLVRLATAGLSWSGVGILLISMIWLTVSLIDWLYLFRERKAAAAIAMEDTLAKIQAPLSLVLLLDEPRRGDLDAVESCVRHALRVSEDESDFVVEAGKVTPGSDSALRQFLVRHPGGVFGIFISSRPYISDPERFARETIRDKRLRKAVETHAAWLSVDLVSATPEESAGRHRA
ncbi:MAG: hypothetical protein KDM63_21300, partial [Verrucomicrobiae bacterium]|nr:hypothetical protein [Verrucomicrobiae bacterium]